MARIFGVVVATAGTLLSAPMPIASAESCPDVEVVFARGTNEPPGVGGIGEGFVKALRSQAGAKSVNVYAVRYPASTDFPTAVDGINDASRHIQSMAVNCPETKMVLGGFSQGAAVTGFVTANVVPEGAPTTGVSGPMPPDVADKVAAVALFGKPSTRFMSLIGSPSVVVGPLYSAKTIDLCAEGDPICSDGENGAAHGSYVVNGMTGAAAAFAASKL